MLQLEKKSKVPIYVQIESYFKKRIYSNELRPHCPIPGDAELGQNLGISHLTVRQAYARLQKEGLIYKIRGKGTFVNDFKDRNLQTKNSVLALATRIGLLEDPQSYQQYTAMAELVAQFARKEMKQSFQVILLQTPLGKLLTGEIESRDIDQLMGAPLCGLFTNGFDMPKELYEKLKQKEMPIVTFPHARGNVDDYVAVDQKESIITAINHLKTRGRKTPAFLISGIFYRTQEVEKEWLLSKLQEHGFEPNPNYIIEINRHFEMSGQCAAKHLLRMTPAIDAIVTLDDSIMRGVCAACLQLNVTVPDNFTLISETVTRWKQPFLLPVARVNIDFQHIVKIAYDKMQLLLNRQCTEHLPKLVRGKLIPEDFPWEDGFEIDI